MLRIPVVLLHHLLLCAAGFGYCSSRPKWWPAVGWKAYDENQCRQKAYITHYIRHVLLSTLNCYRQSCHEHFDGLMQMRCNSSALTMELHLFCIRSSTCSDSRPNQLVQTVGLYWALFGCSPNLYSTNMISTCNLNFRSVFHWHQWQQ